MTDLSGLIDAHVHSAPDVVPRLLNDLELAQQARAAGLAGILIKSHVTLTADRARIASLSVPGIQVWGGLVLNRAVGGFNPAAVEAAARLGAKEIWMPTIDAANHCRAEKQGREGLSLEGSGERRALHEILMLIAQHDMILGTGHLSVAEIVTLVPMARAAGVRKILITHPEAPVTGMPLSVQRDLAGLGCRFERVWVFTTPALNQVLRPEDVIVGIRQVGHESTVLATDMGQVGNPSPVEGLRDFVDACRQAGLDDRQIRRMGSESIAEWLA